MKRLRPVLALSLLMLALAACSMFDGVETDPTYGDKDQEALYKHGSLMSDKGGIDVMGGDEKKTGSGEWGLGVNGYLWRASLDTISFMPILSADPFGGVIITDWYSAPETPNERVKLNIFIRDRELRADGIKVSIFRQTRDDSTSAWVDAATQPATAGQLENTILTKARQIRLAQKDNQ